MVGDGGGVKNMENMTLLFFGSKIMNLLVFFDFEPKKCFLRSLCTFQPFLLCWRFWRPR